MHRPRLSSLVIVAACLVASSCSTGGCGFVFGVGSEPATTAARATASADPTAPVVRPKIVALGDSLTVGLGLLESESYPSLLQNKLDEEGYPYEVVNSGCPETPLPVVYAGSIGHSMETFASSSWRLARTTGCADCRSPK